MPGARFRDRLSAERNRKARRGPSILATISALALFVVTDYVAIPPIFPGWFGIVVLIASLVLFYWLWVCVWIWRETSADRSSNR